MITDSDKTSVIAFRHIRKSLLFLLLLEIEPLPAGMACSYS